MAKTAISPTRAENFSEWYQKVISSADLAESSPVRGCMTIKPYGFAIWELIRDELDKRIKEVDVQNAYFPLLIPLSYMTKEAEHVEGFAKECAVVTNYRLYNNNGTIEPDPEAKLTEPYIIRPTSETIIGEAMSRWVQSYRDLPLKLNQWANVMRWEKRTRIFLRTSEFLWQEGHNVFASLEDATEDALKMIYVYNKFSSEILAIDSILGPKTDDDKFAGADTTFAMEHIMQDGKSLQAGTSHNLGQHFSKTSNIQFLDKEGGHKFAYTTSWGVSTRLMGSLIMSHSDDDGLVLPPTIAPYQVVIIPLVKEDNQEKLIEYANKIKDSLKEKGIRTHLDLTDDRSSDKIWKWIKKGVPVRIEIGDKELVENTITTTRRDIGRDSKKTESFEKTISEMAELLNAIQNDLLKKSKQRNKDMVFNVNSVEEIEDMMKDEKAGVFKILYSKTIGHGFEKGGENKYKLSYICLDMEQPEYVYIAKTY